MLFCHDCSWAEPSCAQAIRELPLLPLTSLTRFSDNTHIFLSFFSLPVFSLLSFSISLPPFTAYVCVRGKLILWNNVLWEQYEGADLHVLTGDLIHLDIPMNYPKEAMCSCVTVERPIGWCVCMRLHRFRHVSTVCDCCVCDRKEEREKASCWLAYMSIQELSAQPSWDRRRCLRERRKVSEGGRYWGREIWQKGQRYWSVGGR